MADFLSEAAGQVGKQAVKAAAALGREAWDEANRKETPVMHELEAGVGRRWERLREELRATGREFRSHPGRAAAMIGSAAVLASVVVLRKRLKARL